MNITRFLCASLCLLAVACGGVVVDPAPEVQPKAIQLFVPDGEGCATRPPLDTAAAVLAPGDTGDEIAVTDIYFTEECTGAGGQYVLAREIDGFRYFWLGGHACYFVEGLASETGLVFGVVRYRMTAGISEIPAHVCVAWPGEPDGLQTYAKTSAIALFEQLEEAKAFAGALK
ncbi:hypothetical protein KEG38_27505 [Polyangium jinanense]|uniref:hypothetical protein n=1 Tax=Polyangium jinanense TaxID=2829994 RepID=UPI0023417D7D|nr:hypothetical protein [Polyangium jinanense]MDC3957636.1 hypothetical protein [Polyangium jinanense]